MTDCMLPLFPPQAIPSREELTSKNFVQVKECKLVWQKSGDHLCVAVERHNKRKTVSNQHLYFGIDLYVLHVCSCVLGHIRTLSRSGPFSTHPATEPYLQQYIVCIADSFTHYIQQSAYPVL